VNEAALIALALVIFGWAILTERLAAHNLTGPLVFLVAGFVVGNSSWGIVSVELESSTVHHLAEITLALLLFADASTVRLAAARGDLRLTSRLLGVGLPLSILAGTLLAAALFPDLPIALAAFVGASLAPTDAALSASVIADERLPVRVRRVLNVESGLNDGIATPVVTFCIAAAATSLGVASHSYDDGFGALVELAIGVAIGVGVAIAGGRLVRVAYERGWTQEGSRRYATLALALLSFLVATEAGGNPFVAAFVGGLVFGAAAPTDAETATELTEMFGGLLSLALWFVFGAGFLLPALERLDARTVAYAVLSLTVVRMVPVAVSLARTGERHVTTAFVGWFGPRGLASVVFALLAVEELAHDPRLTTAIDIITVTVLFSVIAHGITARPLAGRYVRALRTPRPDPAGPPVAPRENEEEHDAPPA
jgi:NhaP-type Na+/H+ or K+/H+ antiporter